MSTEVVPTYRNNEYISLTPWPSARLSEDAYLFLNALCRKHGIRLSFDAKSASGPFRALLYNPTTDVTIEKWDRSSPSEAALSAFRVHLETR